MSKPGLLMKVGASLLALLLTASSSANSYDPWDCTPEMMCACFTDKELDKIAAELKQAEACKYALAEYMRFAEKVTTKQVEWYQEPTIIIGGVVITAGIFGFLGYAVGAGK